MEDKKMLQRFFNNGLVPMFNDHFFFPDFQFYEPYNEQNQEVENCNSENSCKSDDKKDGKKPARRFNDFGFGRFPRYAAMPPVNITENETGFNIEVSAPGYDKQDFKVDVDNDVLTISAEKKSETENTDEKTKVHRREFSSCSFQRSFTLPAGINYEKISGNYDNGILKLNIPLSETAKKTAIEIK